jgi:threonine dehydrogenase-like Zn-dependent dehydrogenase
MVTAAAPASHAPTQDALTYGAGSMSVPIFRGEGRLSYETRPVPPVVAPDDVIVRIEACGICGTDLNILAVPAAHKATPGIIIGHEGVGIVAQVGPAVRGLAVGDRVVIANRLTCGKCAYCRRGLDNQCTNYQTIGTTIDGAFAPYAAGAGAGALAIDPSVPRDDAALFEPLACAVGAVKRAPFQAGDNVAIIGAGPMGLLFALLYRTLGAGKVILLDLAPYRLEFAQTDWHGRRARRDAGRCGRRGQAVDRAGRRHRRRCSRQPDRPGDPNWRGAAGQVILFGLRAHDNPPVNQYTITRYDLTLHGAFVGLHPFAQTIQLLESRRVQPSILVTHRLPLAELAHGVELMRTQQAMKVLIEM